MKGQRDLFKAIAEKNRQIHGWEDKDQQWVTIEDMEAIFPGQSPQIGILFKTTFSPNHEISTRCKVEEDHTYWNLKVISVLFPNWQATLQKQPLVLECCCELYKIYEDIYYPGLSHYRDKYEQVFDKLKGSLVTEEDENRVREAMGYINQMGFGERELAFFNQLAQWDVIEKNELHRQTNRVTQRRSMQRL